METFPPDDDRGKAFLLKLLRRLTRAAVNRTTLLTAMRVITFLVWLAEQIEKLRKGNF